MAKLSQEEIAQFYAKLEEIKRKVAEETEAQIEKEGTFVELANARDADALAAQRLQEATDALDTSEDEFQQLVDSFLAG